MGPEYLCRTYSNTDSVPHSPRFDCIVVWSQKQFNGRVLTREQCNWDICQCPNPRQMSINGPRLFTVLCPAESWILVVVLLISPSETLTSQYLFTAVSQAIERHFCALLLSSCSAQLELHFGVYIIAWSHVKIDHETSFLVLGIMGCACFVSWLD